MLIADRCAVHAEISHIIGATVKPVDVLAHVMRKLRLKSTRMVDSELDANPPQGLGHWVGRRRTENGVGVNSKEFTGPAGILPWPIPFPPTMQMRTQTLQVQLCYFPCTPPPFPMICT